MIEYSMLSYQIASCISSSVIVFGSSKNFSNNFSSYSATASTRCCLHSFTSSIISSGIGTSWKVIPCEASSHTFAFIVIRSTTPLTDSSAPIGNCNVTAFAPSISLTFFTTFNKSAPERSILFTKPIRGTLYLLASRQTVSLCGSTPLTAQNNDNKPSSTRKERSTSTVKST